MALSHFQDLARIARGTVVCEKRSPCVKMAQSSNQILVKIYSREALMDQNLQFVAGVTTGIFCLMLTYQLAVSAIGFLALLWA